MGVLSWLRKAGATVPELNEQATAAQAEHDRAEAALVAAQAAFDEEGTERAGRHSLPPRKA
jgi:hypothetical protein